MAILVPSWLDFSWQARLQMRLKFCMVEVTNRMGSPIVQYNIPKLYCSFAAPHTICDSHHTKF
jgi:hypothetical protein